MGKVGGTGAPRGGGNSGRSQGPAAGGETVTITEFSNGNGSADGRARGTAWYGTARHGMDTVMEPRGWGWGNKGGDGTMALALLPHCVPGGSGPSSGAGSLGCTGVYWGAGGAEGVQDGTGNLGVPLSVGGCRGALGCRGSRGCGQGFGVQGVLECIGVYCRGHWEELGGTGVCCERDWGDLGNIGVCCRGCTGMPRITLEKRTGSIGARWGAWRSSRMHGVCYGGTGHPGVHWDGLRSVAGSTGTHWGVLWGALGCTGLCDGALGCTGCTGVCHRGTGCTGLCDGAMGCTGRTEMCRGGALGCTRRTGVCRGGTGVHWAV